MPPGLLHEPNACHWYNAGAMPRQTWQSGHCCRAEVWGRRFRDTISQPLHAAGSAPAAFDGFSLARRSRPLYAGFASVISRFVTGRSRRPTAASGPFRCLRSIEHLWFHQAPHFSPSCASSATTISSPGAAATARFWHATDSYFAFHLWHVRRA